jgi:signal transduction histidine kinase
VLLGELWKDIPKVGSPGWSDIARARSVELCRATEIHGQELCRSGDVRGLRHGYIQVMSTLTPATTRWNVARSPGGWTIADLALATVLLVALVGEILASPEMEPRIVLLAGTIVTCLPVAWRQTHPAAVAVVSCAGNLLMSIVSTGPFSPQLAIAPLLIVLFSAATRVRARVAVATGAVTFALTVLAHASSPDGELADFWPWLLWAATWAAGSFVRRRGDLAAHHAKRAAMLEVEAATIAADSAQRERDRIARELHDVVAHSVSVMVVQAGAERLRLAGAPGPTVEALDAIEQAGRQALSELRAMLGVFRDEPAESNEHLVPLPGLSDIPALVSRLQVSGLPVSLEIDPPLDNGERVSAAAPTTGVELAAYRIVQESLTNVVRHAGLVATHVKLTETKSELAVTVRNEKSGSQVPSANGKVGSGRGVIGMRERALAMGGSFVAGANPDGSFGVRAVLPIGRGEVSS